MTVIKVINGQRLLLAAAIAGALVVALGAFGAHALEARLSEARLQSWETATRYLMYHSLAVLVVGALLIHNPARRDLARAGVILLVGVSIFSGSLYILCLTEIHWLVWLTPTGGFTLIAGWLQLAVAAARWRPESPPC